MKVEIVGTVRWDGTPYLDEPENWTAVSKMESMSYLIQQFNEGDRVRLTAELISSPERTPGQVAHQASLSQTPWKNLSPQARSEFEHLADAVLDWDAKRKAR